MTLHAAIEKLLKETGQAMTTQAIARELNQLSWYRKGDGSAIMAGQIRLRAKNNPKLFACNGTTISLLGQAMPELKNSESSTLKNTNVAKSSTKDEHYVLDLCDAVLNRTASRQHRFDFLLGDTNANGKAVRLPVDAYYEDLKLVVEYKEKQHTEAVTFFDKPNRTTVSGRHRGEQRKMYDERRRRVIPQHGLALIEISYSDFNHDSQKRIIRSYQYDVEVVKRILKDYLRR